MILPGLAPSMPVLRRPRLAGRAPSRGPSFVASTTVLVTVVAALLAAPAAAAPSPASLLEALGGAGSSARSTAATEGGGISAIALRRSFLQVEGESAGETDGPDAAHVSREPAGSRTPVRPRPGPAALVLEKGSIARNQLVGLGRDVVVEGEVEADVAVLSGHAWVSGRVQGDVVALGGHVFLEPTARVSGDVFALGGLVDARPGARIGGRAVSYPDASSAWLTLLEGPSLGLPATSPVVLAAKLGLLAAWLVLVLAFFAAGGREMLSTSRSVAQEPLRDFLVGLVGITTLTLTGILLSTLAGALVGVPMLLLVVLLALVLKLWGMVAVFHALGDWLGRKVLRRRWTPLHAATLGLLVLGVLKFLPWVGVWAWTAATLVGVGAALNTKLGRREPWFQAA